MRRYTSPSCSDLMSWNKCHSCIHMLERVQEVAEHAILELLIALTGGRRRGDDVFEYIADGIMKNRENVVMHNLESHWNKCVPPNVLLHGMITLDTQISKCQRHSTHVSQPLTWHADMSR